MLIAFHVASVAVFSIPLDFPLKNVVFPRLERYLVHSGLWQDWRMFAPDPLARNMDCEARVTMADGSTRTWWVPQPRKMGYVERLYHERYNKWRLEMVDDEHAATWNAAAVYAARQVARDPRNPPVRVEMWRHWSDVPPPRPERRWQEPPRREYALESHEKFYETQIYPENLR